MPRDTDAQNLAIGLAAVEVEVKHLASAVEALEPVLARLEAENDFREEREALLRSTIREAVREGLAPVVQRVEKLEAFAANAKTYAGIGAAALAGVAWLVERLFAVCVCALLFSGCVAPTPVPRQGEIITLAVFSGVAPAVVPAPAETTEPLGGVLLEAPK